VARAEVQMLSSGTETPEASKRAARSRWVKIELFVRTRKESSRSRSVSMNSGAPGRAFSSWMRTPSMSVSQFLIVRMAVVYGVPPLRVDS